MELSRKCQQISASVTLAITAKAKKLKSEGVDVISFGAGEPDFNTPLNIQNAGIEAIKKGFTKYTPASGTSELKESICYKLKRDNGLSYKPSQIVVSNGAKHSLYNTLMAICNPGDEVIIANPYWVSYPELVKLVDAVPVFVQTKEENNFKYTEDDLVKAITNKTKAIILNSPNNPTGVAYSKKELAMIANLAVKYDLFVISDEIYEKLVYDDVKHISIASLSEEMKNRTIVVNGVSKAYAMTGWRIGYAAAPENVSKIMSNVQSHCTSNPNSIAQYASVEALRGPQDTVELMRREFEKRRNYMVKKINTIPGLSCKMPSGAFYVMVNISRIKGMVVKGYTINSSLDFCNALLNSEKVAAIPGSAFGADDFIRLSYATSLEAITKGLNRIENFIL
ncbi:MAG TPA: aspartate aminotransferase [Clostridiaceae bacterium]|jgi:aspartate aminotransferase|nr:aspartate aminotransferase [Clostridiaceae bacterium]HBF76456.1 aspartate aminotransferase [Clostridiaceae bacterium]HBG38959.1 aspartate aminotransferase [Clostridiaceae bacterium]HBN29470.1 aspartate aminotransferase [Clostridiaceae bacterium]HBX48875.1 aspartate aminotransferase [Clostridiaceae bacterium]